MDATHRQPSGFLVSLAIHAAILGSLYFIRDAVKREEARYELETVLADEQRPHDDVIQQLDTQVAPAESLNVLAGGVVSTKIGGQGGSGVAGGGDGGPGKGGGVKAGADRLINDPQLKINFGTGGGIPGLETIGDDLSAGQVTGEVGAVVAGYGAALDRLSQELIRMLRREKLLVVWLFDESESMKDDQQELKTRFQRVYEELKLIDKDDPDEPRKKKDRAADVLLTAITSFGGDYHVHTAKPTSDPAIIVPAIDKIPIDKSGKENTCAAISKAMSQFGPLARGGRKLVIIVVSDESGDDGEHVEETLQQAKSLKAPIYILGRESVFGSLYAHVRWVQPISGSLHYLPIRRGPETPFAEQLQWDGFRRRRDAQMSGFGPYEQVRLCRDTGGIFFQLPNEETDINELDNRKLEALDLREYLPNIESRREYQGERDRSAFRKAVWDVILMLNPYDERFKGMEIPEHENFSVNPAESRAAAVRRLQQITSMIAALHEAQKHLEQVNGLRAKEPSIRWRANYDLIYAQIFAYKVRLFEYAVALDQFSKTMPQRIKNPNSNRWAIATGARQLIFPDAEQAKALKISKKDVEDAYEKAQKQLQQVIDDHPKTAWSRRAEWEMGRGFGATFSEWRYDPPKTPPPPRPPAPPPPKL